jgi:hypothetical protein
MKHKSKKSGKKSKRLGKSKSLQGAKTLRTPAAPSPLPMPYPNVGTG